MAYQHGPPLSPQVWLQGAPGAWEPRYPNLGDLWHAMRIAVLAAAPTSSSGG
jgi:hypothetical protein